MTTQPGDPTPELPADFQTSPVEWAVDRLREELPGFKTHINDRTNTVDTVGLIAIGGPLKVGTRITTEMLYQVASEEHAKQVVNELIAKTRLFVSEQIGLEKYIDEVRRSAERAGFKNGRAVGVVTGKEEGYALGLAEGRRQAIEEIRRNFPNA